jgi:hypothetical protein
VILRSRAPRIRAWAPVRFCLSSAGRWSSTACTWWGQVVTDYRNSGQAAIRRMDGQQCSVAAHSGLCSPNIHLPRMDLHDSGPGLLIGHWELNLAVQAA